MTVDHAWTALAAQADAARSNWFRNVYSVPAGVPLYGPWSGSLDPDGETVELYRPDTPQPGPGPDEGYVPQVLVERVVYGPAAPWRPRRFCSHQ